MQQQALAIVSPQRVLIASILFLFSAFSAFAAPGLDFRELVKTAGPAVVNINTERNEQVRSMPPGMEMFRGIPDIDRFFDQFEQFQGRPDSPTRKSHSLGSGFFISADGYIVTNNHVIEGADAIRVSTGETEEKTYDAEVIGVDPSTDLALLKIDTKGMPFLRFGNSDKLEVGEWVVAIGSPLGLDHTVTAGIISAKGRSLQAGPYDDFLQTDASINRGNSGGPLLNLDGEVVGINTAIAQRAQGIGFAIPSTSAEKIISALREDRKVSRGWLGVTIQNVNEAIAKSLGMPNNRGVLIDNVLEGQPAAEAGLQGGDVILSINGQETENADKLLRTVAAIAPKSKATVTVWRDGKRQNFSIIVAERATNPSMPDEGSNKDEEASASRLGIKIRAITPEESARFSFLNGTGVVVTTVARGSSAAEAGIRVGDIIQAVNRIPVKSVQDFRKQVNDGTKKRGALLLHVRRGEASFFVGIDMKDKDK